MDKKFLILLFATIFYNGVSHCTPIDGQQISEVNLHEQKPLIVPPPTAAVDHIEKKMDTVPLGVLNISTPVFQNVSSPPQHIEAPKEKNATAHSENKSNTDVHTVDIKNSTQDAANKINTQVIDNKSTTQTTDNNNMKQTTEGKNASKPADDKHATVPVPIPISGNSSEKPITTLPGKNTNTSSTPTIIIPTTTTTVKPTTAKPTVTTVGPNSTSKSSVIAEQNTPAPAQEKHFDGPSFIGGIVLTIGLTAIGFIAFKYYKSGKIDMNYRTL